MIGVKFEENKIVVCHGQGKTDQMIVTFINRKDAEAVSPRKKKYVHSSKFLPKNNFQSRMYNYGKQLQLKEECRSYQKKETLYLP